MNSKRLELLCLRVVRSGIAPLNRRVPLVFVSTTSDDSTRIASFGMVCALGDTARTLMVAALVENLCISLFRLRWRKKNREAEHQQLLHWIWWKTSYLALLYEYANALPSDAWRILITYILNFRRFREKKDQNDITMNQTKDTVKDDDSISVFDISGGFIFFVCSS